jgi:predicted RNA-binding Zn-ribbon protein involved in translation (DUF1610 family)
MNTINTKRDKRTNIITSPKDLANRYCTHCYVQLIHDEINNIFKCPRCNVSTILANTSPDTKIRTTFPTHDHTSPNRQHIIQSNDESLPRSERYIRKRLADKNKEEDHDPYLQMLKQNNQIRITNVEYYSWDDDDHLYD